MTFHISGLITTSGRKLDRENQAEHVLEVSNAFNHIYHIEAICIQPITKLNMHEATGVYSTCFGLPVYPASSSILIFHICRHKLFPSTMLCSLYRYVRNQKLPEKGLSHRCFLASSIVLNEDALHNSHKMRISTPLQHQYCNCPCLCFCSY